MCHFAFDIKVRRPFLQQRGAPVRHMLALVVAAQLCLAFEARIVCTCAAAHTPTPPPPPLPPPHFPSTPLQPLAPLRIAARIRRGSIPVLSASGPSLLEQIESTVITEQVRPSHRLLAMRHDPIRPHTP